MARNKLVMRKLQELSAVDHPGNQHSSVAIFKRATGAAAAKQIVRKGFASAVKKLLDAATSHVTKEAQSYAQTRAVDSLWTHTSALSQSISSIISDDTDSETKAKQLDVTISQFRDAIQALNVDDSAFTGLEDGVQKDSGACPECGAAMGAPHGADCSKEGTVAKSIPPAAAAPPAGATGDTTPDTEGEPTMKKAPLFTTVEQANAHIAKLQEENDTLVEKVATLEDAADPLASITKGMQPAAAKLFREQAETIAKLSAGTRDAVVIAKAQEIVGKTGANVSIVTKVLKALGDDKESTDYVATVFKNYDAMLSELDGMSIGTEGGAEGGTDALSALDAAAAEVQKLNPKLSHAECVTKALAINPALYDETELAEAARS